MASFFSTCTAISVVLLCVVLHANNVSSVGENPALVFWHGFGMSFKDESAAMKPTFVDVMGKLAAHFYNSKKVPYDPPVFSMAASAKFTKPVRYSAFNGVKEDDRKTGIAMDLKDQVTLATNHLIELVKTDEYVQKHGMVFLAFSQGGVVARAVIYHLKPNVNADHKLLLSLIHLLVTFGSPHEGIGVPPKEFLPKQLRGTDALPADIETFLASTSPFKHLTRLDTTTTELGKVRNLLAEINNEDNAHNMLRLDAFIMIVFTEDKVANPISTQCMKLKNLAVRTICHPFNGGHLNFSKAPQGWEAELAAEILCLLGKPKVYEHCIAFQPRPGL